MNRPNETSKRSSSRAKADVRFKTPNDGSRRHVALANDTDRPFEGFATVSDPDGYSYDDPLPEPQLPGAGIPYSNCGSKLRALFCENCADTASVGRACRRFSCPRCHESGEFHRAQTLASKLESFKRDANVQRDDEKNMLLHHLVVSFPEGVRFNSSEPFERALEAVKLLLQWVNVDTGCILYHPYKVRSASQTVDGHQVSLNGGWHPIRTVIEHEDWPTVRNEQLVFDPHFHVIGVSESVYTEGYTDVLEDQTGVVIRRLTRTDSDDTDPSIRDLEDLCRILLSELTHVGVSDWKDGSQQTMTRMFGTVANSPSIESTHAKVTATLRAIAEPILDVDFSPRQCANCPVTGTGRCRCHAAVSSGKSQGHDQGVCGGRLLSLHAAPEKLADEAWRTEVGTRYGTHRLRGLRKAVAEWVAQDGIHPPQPPTL